MKRLEFSVTCLSIFLKEKPLSLGKFEFLLENKEQQRVTVRETIVLMGSETIDLNQVEAISSQLIISADSQKYFPYSFCFVYEGEKRKMPINFKLLYDKATTQTQPTPINTHYSFKGGKLFYEIAVKSIGPIRDAIQQQRLGDLIQENSTLITSFKIKKIGSQNSDLTQKSLKSSFILSRDDPFFEPETSSLRWQSQTKIKTSEKQFQQENQVEAPTDMNKMNSETSEDNPSQKNYTFEPNQKFFDKTQGQQAMMDSRQTLASSFLQQPKTPSKIDRKLERKRLSNIKIVCLMLFLGMLFMVADAFWDTPPNRSKPKDLLDSNVRRKTKV